MASDLGLSIEIFQPFRDFEGVDQELFGRNLDRAERKFDLMEELGASLVLVCSNVSPRAAGDDALISGGVANFSVLARRWACWGREGRRRPPP